MKHANASLTKTMACFRTAGWAATFKVEFKVEKKT